MFKLYLGMDIINEDSFYDMIKLVHPHVQGILDEMCEAAKEEMKAVPAEQLGSWTRAVTTSDGVWHTRGFQVPQQEC